MGRPKKQTVNYFPHDTNASHSRTLAILQSKFGNDGVLAWWRILELLGRSDGHVYRCDDSDNWEFLVAELHIADISVTETLHLLAKLGAIDAELWDRKIIWCQNFVNRLSQIYDKRKDDLPSKPSISVTETLIPVTEMTQSKLKELKEGNLGKGKPARATVYGEFDNVELTDEEHRKLTERFGVDLPQLIENLSSGIASKGYKYKSHYATLLNWARRDSKASGNGHGPATGANRPMTRHYTRPEDLRLGKRNGTTDPATAAATKNAAKNTGNDESLE
jgi:hypothetical protein